MTKSKSKVYEGKLKEKCKSARKKWIILTLVGFLTPLLLACICGWYKGETILIELFRNGDIILSLFSVTVPATIDIFEIKKYKDDKLEYIFIMYIVFLILQAGLYILIRSDAEGTSPYKSVIVSTIFVIGVFLWCSYSLNEITRHKYKKIDDTIDKEENNDEE